MLSERKKLVPALAPAADRFDGDPETRVISMAQAEEITFLVYHDGGTTGKATITVEACDDFTPSNVSAIPFRYRKRKTGGEYDEPQESLGTATAAGTDTTPAVEEVVEVYVNARDLPDGYPNVRLCLDEAADDPVSGCVLAELDGVRYPGLVQDSVLS
mgnify:CR=1 FL=1